MRPGNTWAAYNIWKYMYRKRNINNIVDITFLVCRELLKTLRKLAHSEVITATSTVLHPCTCIRSEVFFTCTKTYRYRKVNKVQRQWQCGTNPKTVAMWHLSQDTVTLWHLSQDRHCGTYPRTDSVALLHLPQSRHCDIVALTPEQTQWRMLKPRWHSSGSAECT